MNLMFFKYISNFMEFLLLRANSSFAKVSFVFLGFSLIYIRNSHIV